MKIDDFKGIALDDIDAAFDGGSVEEAVTSIFDGIAHVLDEAGVEHPVELQLIHSAGYEERLLPGDGDGTVTLRFQRPAIAVAWLNDDILFESAWWGGLMDVEPSAAAVLDSLAVALAGPLSASQPSRRVLMMRGCADSEIEATARSIPPHELLEDSLRITVEVYRLNRARALTREDMTLGVEIRDGGQKLASKCLEIAEEGIRLIDKSADDASFSLVFTSVIAFARSMFAARLDALEEQLMAGGVDARGDLGFFMPLAEAWFAGGRSPAEL